jgi:hypothetical protein
VSLWGLEVGVDAVGVTSGVTNDRAPVAILVMIEQCRGVTDLDRDSQLQSYNSLSGC